MFSDDPWQELSEIEAMSPGQFDALAFGAIQLDVQGVILAYNDTEAKISGRDKRQVIGKNFFTEVAPCTNVKAFAGRFREGVARQSLHAVFPYRFDFRMTPRRVNVALVYSAHTKSAWVFVTDMGPG